MHNYLDNLYVYTLFPCVSGGLVVECPSLGNWVNFVVFLEQKIKLGKNVTAIWENCVEFGNFTDHVIGNWDLKTLNGSLTAQTMRIPLFHNRNTTTAL